MEPFKNKLDYKAGKKIALAIERSYPQFNTKNYLKNLKSELAPLELKERVTLLSEKLSTQISSHSASFKILVDSLKQNEKDKLGLESFLVWPLTEFIAIHGINNFNSSLAALKEMTKVFTSEFAVRPFFIKYEEKTLKLFQGWSTDPNEHVRRLVSEGSRPMLPWGLRLHRFLNDPALTWPLLSALKDDPSKYVQKSVANHINDLSKKNGAWVVNQLKKWPNPWVVKHALRSLIKEGHPEALKLLGYDTSLPKFKDRLLKKTIHLGESLSYEIALQNIKSKKIKINIDVEIFFLKSNGTHSPKVFKGKSLELKKNEKRNLVIKTPIRQVTTRTHFSGTQQARLIINGHKTKEKSFTLQC